MVHSMGLADDKGQTTISTDLIAKAAAEIVKALKGSYCTPDGGRRVPVRGDVNGAGSRRRACPCGTLAELFMT